MTYHVTRIQVYIFAGLECGPVPFASLWTIIFYIGFAVLPIDCISGVLGEHPKGRRVSIVVPVEEPERHGVTTLL